MEKQRNQLLNIVEAIATFLVVFIHFPFPGRVGSIITSIARISVPFFFCVSGYFFYKGDAEAERSSIPRKIKHLFLLVFLSELSYILFYYALQIRITGFSLQSLSAVIDSQLNAYFLADPIPYLFVFAPPINAICWFIGSLIVVYLVIALVAKHIWQKPALVVSITLLFVGILLRRVLFYLQVDTTFPYERLLPFLPLPFFVIGYHIHKCRGYFDGVQDRIYGLAIVGGIVLAALESFSGVHTLYFSTPLIVFAVIPFCAKHERYAAENALGRLFSHIGSSTATYIYIFHMMVGNVLYVIVPRVLPINENHVVYQWGIPIMICIASAIGAEVISIVRRIVFTKRRSVWT